MTVQFQTLSGGGDGVQHDLDGISALILADGVQRYSTNNSVVEGAGGRSVTLNTGASVQSFGSSPTIELTANQAYLSAGKVVIGSDASVLSSSKGISLYGSRGYVENHGFVSSRDYAVDIGGQFAWIANFGTMTGREGVSVSGKFGFVENHGDITGRTNIGVQLNGENSKLTNTGTITSEDLAVISLGEGRQDILNTGTIIGTTAGILFNESEGRIINHGLIQNSEETTINSGTVSVNAPTGAITVAKGSFAYGFYDSEPLYLLNTGEIVSPFLAYYGGKATDTIVNTGSIVGDVVLYDGDDVFRGASGHVAGEILAGKGDDWVFGGRGDDVVFGDDGRDTLLGGRGDDYLHGNGWADTVRGGLGDDTVKGGLGADLLMGGRGEDILEGGMSHDTLRGGFGADTLDGGDGKDVLIGGPGNDQVTGGGGADTFVYRPSDGRDLVTDFEQGLDKVDLQAFGFAGFQDFQARTVTRSTSDSVVITFDLDDTLTLNGLSGLKATDFFF